MRKILSLAAVLALAVSLTSCSSTPFVAMQSDLVKLTFDSPNGFGFGITGEELPPVSDTIDLKAADLTFYHACQAMSALETNRYMDIDQTTKVSKDDALSNFKESIRVELKGLSDAYPDVGRYIYGAKKRIAKRAVITKSYLAYQERCKPYLALIARSAKAYKGEIAIGDPTWCWKGNSFSAQLQRRLGQRWVTVAVTRPIDAVSIGCPKSHPNTVVTRYAPLRNPENMRWYFIADPGATLEGGYQRRIGLEMFVYQSGRIETRGFTN